MKIKKLALQDFRNFEILNLEQLNSEINVFSGKNAMGKTNLIEAINYISCGRSFRSVPDQKLIRDGQKFAGIHAQYETVSHQGKIEIGIFGEAKRSVRVNGLPIKKISELIGIVNSIVFAPEDLRIIKESPSLRRKMMDMELCKISASYYHSLQSYNIALKSKNKLLKDAHVDDTLIRVYNEQMAQYGAELIKKRAEFIEDLNKYSSDFYENLQEIDENIQLRYKISAALDDIQFNLLEKMQNNIKKEREMGISLIGPHREDIEILVNGRDSKIYASQGQQRTAMLAIKLACLEIAEKKAGESPILLLDDVFSELDKHRREKLMEIVSKKQVFITCTDLEGISHFKNASYYYVENANVKKE